METPGHLEAPVARAAGVSSASAQREAMVTPFS